VSRPSDPILSLTEVIDRKDKEIDALIRRIEWFKSLMNRIDPSTGIKEGCALYGGRLVWEHTPEAHDAAQDFAAKAGVEQPAFEGTES
jgi:hypothetical protein